MDLLDEIKLICGITNELTDDQINFYINRYSEYKYTQELDYIAIDNSCIIPDNNFSNLVIKNKNNIIINDYTILNNKVFFDSDKSSQIPLYADYKFHDLNLIVTNVLKIMLSRLRLEFDIRQGEELLALSQKFKQTKELLQFYVMNTKSLSIKMIRSDLNG